MKKRTQNIEVRRIFNQNYEVFFWLKHLHRLDRARCGQKTPPDSLQHESPKSTKQNEGKTSTAHEKKAFVVLYPAADDEFERFESCRTGIREGRLIRNPEQQKEFKRELKLIENWLFASLRLVVVLSIVTSIAQDVE